MIFLINFGFSLNHKLFASLRIIGKIKYKVIEKMKIDTFLTSNMTEQDKMFDGAIGIYIDVLRASTTVCAALYHGAKEVIPVESTEKAVSIYSSLSKDKRFLGGERNCHKPNGFDAGNSPAEYNSDTILNKSVILATTNGTGTFLKARQTRIKLIAAFVNLDATVNHISELISQPETEKLFIFCAGSNGRIAYEDTLAAGAIIDSISKRFSNIEMTDTSDIALDSYNLHKTNINDFLRTREHAQRLIKEGFAADLDIAFEMNLYPIVALNENSSIKIL